MGTYLMASMTGWGAALFVLLEILLPYLLPVLL
jgi:hypothetical protein